MSEAILSPNVGPMRNTVKMTHQKNLDIIFKIIETIFPFHIVFKFAIITLLTGFKNKLLNPNRVNLFGFKKKKKRLGYTDIFITMHINM